MSGIEEIMGRQDESISEEDRKKENEMWMGLLKTLNAEKKRLGDVTEAEKPSEKTRASGVVSAVSRLNESAIWIRSPGQYSVRVLGIIRPASLSHLLMATMRPGKS